MNRSLKDQLTATGFQQTPEKIIKKSRGAWKKEVRNRLLKTDHMLFELKTVIRETHDHFKAEEGSGKWFRAFLKPLYELKGELEIFGNPESILAKKGLVKNLW